jgi:DNA-binding IclR family transcriptional regulator
MQTNPYTPREIALRWGVVLLALHRAGKFVSLDELTKLAELAEPEVMNSLTFLAVQGWVECQPDGLHWNCTPQMRVIMESMSKNFAKVL